MGFFDKLKGKAKVEVEVEVEPEEEAPASDQSSANEGYSIQNSEWYEKHLRSPMHFGAFDPDNLDGFFFAYFELQDAEAEDRLAPEMAKYHLGSKDEWGRIWASFLRRHFTGMSEREMGEKFLVLMATARNQQAMLKFQSAQAADPSLTQPVEGVSVEGWAQAAVGMANAGGDVPRATAALAKLGMDLPKYERVNAEYQARMQRDTSFVIAQIYGKAFSSAQGVQGGFGLGSADGSLQELGAEPCTFERYAEVMGAMGAWGESGQDVNAMLKQVFDMTAMDLSRFSGYWSTRFAADPNLALSHVDLSDRYKARYAGAGHDHDLSV